VPYITPPTTPTAYTCRRLSIPDSPEWLAAVAGAITELAKAYRWQQIDGISPQEAAEVATKMHLESLETSCLIGLITPYITAELPPNCLPCDGTTRLRVDYPRLYDLIEPGLRIDADTFALPTIQGRFIFAVSDDYPLYSFGGQPTVALTVDQLPEHDHATEPHSHETLPHSHAEGIAVPTVINGGLEAPAAATSASIGTTGAATVSVVSSGVTVLPTGSGAQHENMPPYVCLRYCLVAK